MGITRQEVKTLRSYLQEAIDGLGVGDTTFTVGSASFDPIAGNGHFKVDFASITSEGVVETPERIDFIRFASNYGLTPDNIDDTFVTNGTQYRITGLKTRRKKFPISGERVSDGKPFKFTADQVVIALTRK